MKPLRQLLAVITLVVVLPLGNQAKAIELGLEPSDVFGLWTNINNILVDFGKRHLESQPEKDRYASLKPKSFHGKVPSDVLNLVVKFGLLASPVYEQGQGFSHDSLLEKNIVFLVRHNKTETTPSVVFMRSSDILVSLAHVLIFDHADRPLVSRYFVEHSFTNKTPSDVFSLVDLAIRRLNFLQAHPDLADHKYDLDNRGTLAQ